MIMDTTAQELLFSSEILAQRHQQTLSGVHVLYCAFRQPFPALANALRQAEVSAQTWLERVEYLLASAAVPPGTPFIETLQPKDDGSQIGPEDLFVAALLQQTEPVRIF